MVRELGPSRLPSDVESTVSDIGLDLRHAQSKGVVVSVHVLVDLSVWRELEFVVGFELNNVGNKVRT